MCTQTIETHPDEYTIDMDDLLFSLLTDYEIEELIREEDKNAPKYS